MRKLAALSIALSMVLLLSGCMYAMNKSNTPSTERIRVLGAPGGKYAIRIEHHGETEIPQDGKVDLAVPSLPRGCSIYLFGLIKVHEGSPEYSRAIQVLHDGKIVRKLSLHSLHRLAADKDGYHLVKL